VKQINVMAFELKLLGSMRFHLVFHVSLLEPYTCLPFQEEFMIPFHLLKSMVNMNMKWKTFWIQGFIIVNINILFIGIGMM
jgi:hypothetical protein